jgi:acyl dehydratase
VKASAATVPPSAAGTMSRAIVGIAVGPHVVTIDARWLMAYAAALGERDPRYFDTSAAAGPSAHPLFPVCYEWPLALAVRAAAIAPAQAPLGVHATHRLHVHRAPRAGDVLTTTARVTGVEPRRAGTLVTVRFTTVDAAGGPVTTTDYGSVYRGVACDPPDVSVPDAAGTESAGGPGSAVGTRAAAGTGNHDPEPPAWSDDVEIPATAAHVYTECARIWNPIHTDVAVARAAGLPGLILHGTATLALAVSRVVARDLGGDPERVRGVAARFSGVVLMPSRIRVRSGGHRGPTVSFDAVDSAGAPVLGQGIVHT